MTARLGWGGFALCAGLIGPLSERTVHLALRMEHLVPGGAHAGRSSMLGDPSFGDHVVCDPSFWKATAAAGSNFALRARGGTTGGVSTRHRQQQKGFFNLK